MRSIEVAAVVVFVVTAAVVALAFLLRESAPQKLASEASARLIVGFGKMDATGTRQGQSLHVLNPDTLADLAGC